MFSKHSYIFVILKQKSNLAFASDDFLAVIFPLGATFLKNYKIRGNKVSDDFLRTRLHAVIQLMIESRTSIFSVPQDLLADIERKKKFIQNGEELNLSLLFVTLILK